MDVTLQLLGPVGGQVDGHALALGHMRQRSVLSALLVDVGKPVPTDRLIDRVWGDDAPRRADATLHSYVSRLRNALTHVQRVRLDRRPGGYVLDADPQVIDLHRFRTLVGGARDAANDAVALALLREALSLWRGEPLDGIDTVWADDLRASWSLERHMAELDSIDLALSAGEHARVLAGLVDRAATHPLDERLAGQLMLALYRCGRQADALAHYERIRSRLGEELGAHPGLPLRQLHRQMLSSDRAIGAPGAPDTRRWSETATQPELGTGAARPSQLSTPRQLPAPLVSFTGRQADLALLTGLLPGPQEPSDGGVIAAVCGSPGVGKTCLALRWAHDHLDAFPDGQLYAHLRGFDPTGDPVAPAAVLRHFLEALGVAPAAVPADTTARAGLFRSLMVHRRMLVMLDDARDSEHVRSLMPGRSLSTTIVTSRHRLHGLVTRHGARVIALGTLTERDAMQLLRRRLGDRRLAAEPVAAQALVRHCAGLPLALGITAARAASHPGFRLSEVADELEVAATRLDALGSPEDAVDLRGVIRCSYDALSPEASELFALMALAPGPDIGLSALASLAATPHKRAHAVVGELVAVSLVDEHAPRRYRMHDLVRLLALELADAHVASPRRATAVRRVLDHHLHTAYAADRLLQPQRDPIVLETPLSGVRPDRFAAASEASAWFITEHDCVRAAIDLAVEADLMAHACALAWTVVTYLERHSHWADLVSTQRTAVEAARRLDDEEALARALLGLGFACIWVGRAGEAESNLRDARDRLADLGDRTGLGHAHRGLARLAARQGRHGDALPHDQRALELYRESGHRAGEAIALNAIGWHLAHLGRPEEARTRCHEALSHHRDLGDAWGMALTLDSLGFATHRLGMHAEAIDWYDRALRLLRQIGYRFEEAETLTRLGDVHRGAGDHAAARASWLAAHDIFAGLGHARAGTVRRRLLRHTPDAAADQPSARPRSAALVVA